MTYSKASLAWAAREADRPYASADLKAAEESIAAAALKREPRPLSSTASDRDIRAGAEARADTLRAAIDGITTMTADALGAWLNAQVQRLGARPFVWHGAARGEPPAPDVLVGLMARAVCAIWWRRQLRRAVVRQREREGMQAGEICAHPVQTRGQPRRAAQVYCTDDTVARRMERTAANRAMLEASEIEDEAGQVITLAQAADASTANKAIRRGELMTRIRGCEDWAAAAGMVGVFTTNTAPSRFHPQTMHKGPNTKHQGATPKDAQAWLCATWARARASMQRAGVRCFGFRVAEPHHDGCPHWHMLVWCEPGKLAALEAIMRAAWLADEGDEPGAEEHRFKLKRLEAGGAAGYIAKYIAKNIDDAGAVQGEGHHDTDHAGQADWLGIGKAQRVEAWAAAHGIRQFQALGQPPVTVWRELRRMDAAAVQGAAPAILAAHAAVHRDGDRRACWRGYMAAQGGAMVGRDYGIRLVRGSEPKPGRYGDDTPPAPLGVAHVSRPDEWVLSGRREWRQRGTWAREAAHVVPAQPGQFIIVQDPSKTYRTDDGVLIHGTRTVPNPAYAKWLEKQGQPATPAPPPGLGLGQRLQAACPPRTRLNNCTGRPSKDEPEHRTQARLAPLFAALAWQTSPPPPPASAGQH